MKLWLPVPFHRVRGNLNTVFITYYRFGFESFGRILRIRRILVPYQTLQSIKSWKYRSSLPKTMETGKIRPGRIIIGIAWGRFLLESRLWKGTFSAENSAFWAQKVTLKMKRYLLQRTPISKNSSPGKIFDLSYFTRRKILDIGVFTGASALAAALALPEVRADNNYHNSFFQFSGSINFLNL